MTTSVLSLSRVRKEYPPHQVAVDSLSLNVGRGEFVFVAGPSGAGKSTLLKLLLGAERPTAGTVHVLGLDMGSATEEDISKARKKIGIVFQDFRLLQRKTNLENVGLGLEIQGVCKNDREALSRQMLKAVGLEDRANDFPRMLSGGEQQRIALARALVSRPQILFADEPTGNLDARMTRVVFDLLLEANALGVTIIVASHNLAMIEELNLRTIVLDGGKIVGDFQHSRGLR